MSDVKNQQPAVNTFRRGFLTSPSFVVFLLAISVCGYSVVRALESTTSTTVAAADVGPAVPADLQIPPPSVVQPSAETAGGNRACEGDIKTRLTPIETLQVGQRVRADAPTDEVDRQFGDEVIPSEWRKLTLTAPKRDGTVSDVVLLRPREWLEQQQAEVGGQVYIAVPECGIDGNATVHSIEPCPPITDGPGRVITGTFRHRVADGIELSVAKEPQPIRCTGNHPIWSETKQDFVRADSLEPGESLRTTTGLTRVVSTSSLPGETDVYNFEVHGLHVYHVGESGLLVHNGDPCPEELWDIGTLLANGREATVNRLLQSMSRKNLKHSTKHLSKFQNLDQTMTGSRLRRLGANIAANEANLVSLPNAAQKVFQHVVNIGGIDVNVRVVLNRIGNLHSIYIK